MLIDDGGHLNIGGCSLVLQTTINISNHRIFEQLCAESGEQVMFLNNLVNRERLQNTVSRHHRLVLLVVLVICLNAGSH